jgi:hypothetical protein
VSDEAVPEDFERQLRTDLAAAADHVDGAGITRAGVADAAARHRRRTGRGRALAGLAAAVVLLVAFLVVRSGQDGPAQQVTAGAPTTTTTTAGCGKGSTSDPAGWFRLSATQATALVDAGAITRAEAAGRATHGVLLDYAALAVIADRRIEPFDRQMLDLQYEDSAGLGLLRSEDRLTAEQEVAIDDGIAPVLDQAQVDRIFQQYPSLTAIAAGGQPFPTKRGDVSFAPSDRIELPHPSGCAAGPR